MTPPLPALEVLPRDLSPYRQGNTGIACVHRFDAGRPGPHVLINALTHGNEFCGMVAATHLLDAGVRPHIGRPAVHLGMPQGLGSGTPLVQHDHHGVAVVVECGGHFRRARPVA